MPRVLVVTYQWLPMFNAGVKFVANLCRYLPAAGWEPHILTKDWSDGAAVEDAPLAMSVQPIDASPSLKNAATLPVVRAPYALRDNRWLRRHARLNEHETNNPLSPDAWMRRALDITYPLHGHYPDMQRGWVEPAVKAGLTAVRQYGIGAVVTVCPPASSVIVGGEIARGAGIPWVTLFADLSAFHDAPHWTQRAMAKRWLHSASRAASVSPRMAEYVKETFGVGGDVVVYPFDPEERKVAPHRSPGAPMRLVHTGSINPASQQPQLLFDALDELVRDDAALLDQITVELVGSRNDEWLHSMLAGRPCAPAVQVLDRVPPADAVSMQREADVLLTFNRQGDELGYPRQMFEHWNAGRPTIAVGADAGGFVTSLLAESEAGEVADDAPGLANILRRYLGELYDAGLIAFRGDAVVIARHGAPEQAKRLGALLDAASAERHGSWQRARR